MKLKIYGILLAAGFIATLLATEADTIRKEITVGVIGLVLLSIGVYGVRKEGEYLEDEEDMDISDIDLAAGDL